MDWLDRLFEQAEEQERKRERELKKIANGILIKLPKCDFEPCAVCGNKPELEVTVYGDNTYRLDVKCRKCDWGNGCCLNDYDLNHIPKEPLMPNPKYTWMDHWHTVNEWTKEEHEKFLSPDWKYQCKVCGKKKRGYGIEDFVVIDGEYYCPECQPRYPYKKYQREGNTVVYKSFDDILKAYGGTIKDYVRVCE